jgi:glycosyltransferase involved in cell wall biosynthesis
LRIAIVHPWLFANGGGERVIDALAEMYPKADIFTLVARSNSFSKILRGRNVNASFLSRFPRADRYYQYLMPFYPLAMSSVDLTGYDLILSSGGPATKGVVVRQDAKHIHYCHSPVRFLWDQYPVWHRRVPRPFRPVFAIAAHHNREWDFSSAQRVDHFVANSQYVGERIRTYYRRAFNVIYPPVDTTRGYISKNDDYYICVARLVPGKRIDLLIEACNKLKRKLLIVGSGPEKGRLRALAGTSAKLLGFVDDSELIALYAKARAFLFAAEEDFGIAAVEAQSYGLPVIAYGKGGVSETVVAESGQHGFRSGVLFRKQTASAVCDAIRQFESIEHQFDREQIRQHSRAFDTCVFKDKM